MEEKTLPKLLVSREKAEKKYKSELRKDNNSAIDRLIHEMNGVAL